MPAGETGLRAGLVHCRQGSGPCPIHWVGLFLNGIFHEHLRSAQDRWALPCARSAALSVPGRGGLPPAGARGRHSGLLWPCDGHLCGAPRLVGGPQFGLRHRQPLLARRHRPRGRPLQRHCGGERRYRHRGFARLAGARHCGHCLQPRVPWLGLLQRHRPFDAALGGSWHVGAVPSQWRPIGALAAAHFAGAGAHLDRPRGSSPAGRWAPSPGFASPGPTR